MTEAEKPAFVDLITDALAFYRRDLSDFALSVWWQACQPFTMEQVRKALTAHTMDPEAGKFAPMPGDLVRVLQGTVTDRAMLAWGKVHDAMSSVGAWRNVVFDDPAIHAVIEDMGGWAKLARTETKDLGFVQHRFCESYKAYSGRGNFHYPALLGGDADPSWAWTAAGLKPPKPAVVGDVELARQVYLGGSNGGKTPISIDSAVKLAISHEPGAFHRIGEKQ
jgi:hypothetical protein